MKNIERFEAMVKNSNCTPDEKKNLLISFFDCLTDEIEAMDVLHRLELDVVTNVKNDYREKYSSAQKSLISARTQLKDLNSAFEVKEK